MYRLLAIDLDGTLLTPQHDISPRTLAVLQQAVDAGLRLVIATGRVPYILGDFAQYIPFNAPQITSNGAVIIDPRTHTVLHEEYMPANMALPVIEAAHDLDLQLCYYTDQALFAERSLYSLNNWYLASVPVTPIDDIAQLHTHPCIKLAAFGDERTVSAKRQKLAQTFAGQVYVTQTAEEWLEFLHPHVSKAKGLAFISQLLGIPPEEMIAIGDNHNDLEMLRFAGLGIAMGNADDEIKAAADYITRSNAEDGVAVAIENFALAQIR